MKAHTFVAKHDQRLLIAGLCAIVLMISCTITPASAAQPVRKIVRNGYALFSPARGTALDFGTVRVGETKQQTFSFANTGDDTLFIQSLDLSPGSEFTIQFARLTLAPKQAGTVIVQFAPRDRQSCTATLSFAVANGVATPTLTLHGKGIGQENPETAINPISLVSGASTRLRPSH